MKYLFLVFTVMTSTATFGQTAKELFNSGIEKHNSKDYTGAIEVYSKVIKADPDFRDGYYNRAACELALRDLKSAKRDLDKTIELDPSFAKAYYSRATVLISQEQYKDALPDLDRVIQLEPLTPNALTLRGQIRAQSGNKEGACDDFMRAKSNGDPKAEKYINQFCGGEKLAEEYLRLDWPDSENWKVGDDQENSKQRVIDLVHSNETVDNWTELGNMTSYKGVKGIPVDTAMHLTFQEARKVSPNAQLTFIEKNETVECPWIIFTIEAPNFTTDVRPESQLWYIVQGKQGMYTNFWATKQAKISAESKAKWTAFFKSGRIVNKKS